MGVHVLAPLGWLLESYFSLVQRRPLLSATARTSTIVQGQNWKVRRQRAKPRNKSSFHQWLASSMCALEVQVLLGLTQLGTGDANLGLNPCTLVAEEFLVCPIFQVCTRFSDTVAPRFHGA